MWVSRQIASTNLGQKSKRQGPCLQQLVNLFNDITPEGLPYLQEPTNANLTEGVPAKYFLGGDIKEVYSTLNLTFKIQKSKKNLGNIIAGNLQTFPYNRNFCPWTDWKDLGYHHSTLAGLTVVTADIPVVEDKAEIIEEPHKRVEQITNSSVVVWSQTTNVTMLLQLNGVLLVRN